MARVNSSPLDQDRYLQEHKGDICPGCQLWVPWCRGKRGKIIYACEIGEIPRRDECPYKSKRRQSAR